MSKTVNTKILLRNDSASNWTTNNPTLAKGQIGVEIDTGKFKFGDGTTPWNSLSYGAGADIALASAQANGLMSSTDYSKLAGIASGAQVNQNAFSNVKVGSSTVAADSKTDTLELAAGSNITLTPDTINDKVTIAATVPTKTSDLTNDSGFITSSDIPEGAAASTTTPKMDGTAAVGTELAFARGDHVHPSDTSKMNVSGGTFTGAVTLSGDPTSNLNPATKQYVDTQITTNLAASDAMVFKGTLGTGGTVTAVPTTGVVKGDTYKVITAGTWAGSDCKVGDLLIALNSGSVTATATNWAYVPSGNENETTIKYSTSTQNLTTSAQTGAITVGEAATKQVDTSISSGSTSTKLPTSQAVASYVASAASKVTSSNTNGNIKIDGTETTVYTLPSTTLDSSDTLILDCGSSTTNYS